MVWRASAIDWNMQWHPSQVTGVVQGVVLRTDDTKDNKAKDGNDFGHRVNKLAFAISADTKHIDHKGPSEQERNPGCGRRRLIPVLYNNDISSQCPIRQTGRGKRCVPE